MIHIVLPTRGKPDGVRRLLDSIAERTLDLDGVCVWLGYDIDDQGERVTHEEVPVIAVECRPPGGIGPAMRAGIDAAFEHARCPTDLFVLLGDDFVIQTHGWDELLRGYFARYGRTPVMLYGDDGIQSGRLATHNIMTAGTVGHIGHAFHGGWNTHNDVWLHALFDLFAPSLLRYAPDLKLTHEWKGEQSRNASQWSQDRGMMVGPSAWSYATRQVKGLLELAGEKAPMVRPQSSIANFRFEYRAGEVRTSWGAWGDPSAFAG